METTTLEMSERLVRAGWVKETYFVHRLIDSYANAWMLADYEYIKGILDCVDWLPAPTADEIAEELGFQELYLHYNTFDFSNPLATNYWDFPQWLYATRNSADEMAKV